MTSASELTTAGIAAVKAGDLASARAVLTAAVQSNSEDATAWLWLSAAVGATEEKRYCLNQVLRIVPNSPAALKGLATLGEGAAASPLGAVAQPVEAVAPAAPAFSDRQLLDMLIKNRTNAGWHIVAQTESGVQFQKQRKWNAAGLALFVLLPAFGACLWLPLLVVSLIGLVLVAADYGMQKQETVYVTLAEVQKQVAQAPEKYLYL